MRNVLLELDGRLEVLEEDEHLDVDVSPEVGVAHLQLKQVLVGQVLGEELVLVFDAGTLALRLDGDGVDLEAPERLENVVGKLER